MTYKEAHQRTDSEGDAKKAFIGTGDNALMVEEHHDRGQEAWLSEEAQ